MILLGREAIESFKEEHKDSANALKAWEQLITANDFKHFPDLKETFGSADYDKPDTIFDIGGNKYRVIAIVNYSTRTVLVKEVLTHKEYDKRG